MSGAHRHRDPKTQKWNTTVEGEHTHPDLEARLDALEGVDPDAPEPPVVVPVASMYNPKRYGPAIGNDGRNNKRIGVDVDALSQRFVCSRDDVPVAIAVNERHGTDYSKGDGGLLNAVIYPDLEGKPDMSKLPVGRADWAPGNNGGAYEVKAYRTIAGASRMVNGRRYHIVSTNPASNPSANHVSLNLLFDGTGGSPRQPAFTDDLAVLELRGGVWQPANRYDTPVFDLVYAGGGHDGQAVFGCYTIAGYAINGKAAVRELFTPTEDRLIVGAGFRVLRTSGNADLTIRLVRASGVILGEVRIPASTFPIAPLLPRDPPTGSRWGVGSWAAALASKGQAHALVATTEPGTSYWMLGDHEQDRNDAYADWGSRSFPEGDGQWTADATVANPVWTPLYAYAPVDAQCYMALA